MDNNNNFDEWNSVEEDVTNTLHEGITNSLDEGNSNTFTEEEVEPVRLSKKTTVSICIGLVIILIIILICFKGCSITKKVENTSNSSDSTNSVQQSEVSITTNDGENSEKNVEKSSDSEEVDSSLLDKPNTTEKSEVSERSTEVPKKESNVSSNSTSQNSNKGNSPTNLEEVSEPVLSDIVTTKGLISSKHVYKLDDTYVYGVKILTLQGEESVTCKYFCPKKTWDALIVGDSVSVSYQVDSIGSTSVVSISK